MLGQALSFARTTTQAIQEQLEKDRIPQADILLRSLFETAIRYLYASREPDGWQRLQADAASKDLRWAQKATERPELAPEAQELLKNEQWLARAKEGKELPDVREMLRTIDRRLREDEGKADKPESVFGEYSYFTVYGIMSRPVHGHILALSSHANEATISSISAATIQSAFMLVRAVHYAMHWDSKQVYQKVLSILQGDPQPDRSSEEN
ncbi:MAG: DUF5677 domain-containing protein [Planctomycetota bacterium]|jgi:hypothetical protein